MQKQRSKETPPLIIDKNERPVECTECNKHPAIHLSQVRTEECGGDIGNKVEKYQCIRNFKRVKHLSYLDDRLGKNHTVDQ